MRNFLKFSKIFVSALFIVGNIFAITRTAKANENFNLLDHARVTIIYCHYCESNNVVDTGGKASNGDVVYECLNCGEFFADLPEFID